jgi:cell division protein FtsZ
MFELVQQEIYGANIKVIGVGGAGSNAVETMIQAGLKGVEFVVCNTDKQALEASSATTKLQVGAQLTRGLGAGANPDVGRAAAMEDRALIEEIVKGADMVFITAGMGGGTGTGGAPVIAEVAREAGALTVAVVTKPFNFEGKIRRKHASGGLMSLKEHVDTLITIPNQRLLYIASEKTSILETFKKADEVLLNAVKGITDLINIRGLINLDFADVRTVMSNKGLALMGSGAAAGEHRAMEAATKAISSPLLEDIAINGATGIIINITGGSDLTLFEVNEASTLITEEADENAEIIFGAVIDESMQDEVRVTVIATGFRHEDSQMIIPDPTKVKPKVTPEITRDFEAQEKPLLKPSEPMTVSPELSEGTQGPLPFEQKEVTPRVRVPINIENSVEDAPVQTVSVNTPEPILGPKSEPTAQPKEKRSDNLEAARRLARELGIKNLGDDEYDMPTFLRRPPGSDA